MSDFNSIFPGFVTDCVQLKQLLTPIAYVLLVCGMISSTLTGPRSGQAYARLFVRTMVLVVVLTFLVSWGNTVTTVVDSTVKNVLKVDPSQIYNQYQTALEMQKTPDNSTSWWEKVFSVTATIFESLVSAFLWLLGWVASAIVFYAYILQKIILYMGYTLAPIFIGFFAFGSLFDIAKRYFLNLVGVMLWPLGWGVAGLVTQGLINFMTDQSFLHTGGVEGIGGYTFQNFIGVAFLGIWIIFSTIAAPVIIGKSISEGFAVGSVLMGGAASAGRSAAVTATTVGASVASGGGVAAAAGGVVAGAGAGLESLVATSADMGSGSLIGSLASMRSANGEQKSRNGPVANPSFRDDDLTGDKAVAETLRKAKNRDSQQ
jgi:TrbL/VirB6 plasmid conjugal transfer protein